MESFALALRTYALGDLDEARLIRYVQDYSSEAGTLDFTAFRSFVDRGELTQEQTGRYYVALSLAEAESVRRVMHVRLGSSIIEGTDASIALRCSQSDFIVFDESAKMETASNYNTGVGWSAMKFINCDMYFSQSQLNQLLGALQATPQRERRRFFERIIGCRRRSSKRWRETPVSSIFSIADQWYALCQRALAARIRRCVDERNLKLYDACLFFDSDKNGFISAAEMMGGVHWLGLDFVVPADIVHLVRAYDVDMDGQLSYLEMMLMLKKDYSTTEVEDDEDEDELNLSTPGAFAQQEKASLRLKALLRQTSVGGTVHEHCLPMYEEELDALQEQWLTEQLQKEEEFLVEQVLSIVLMLSVKNLIRLLRRGKIERCTLLERLLQMSGLSGEASHPIQRYKPPLLSCSAC
jgi:Ca2+-binding EF-hand superfamily protein